MINKRLIDVHCVFFENIYTDKNIHKVDKFYSHKLLICDN